MPRYKVDVTLTVDAPDAATAFALADVAAYAGTGYVAFERQSDGTRARCVRVDYVSEPSEVDDGR